MGPKKVIELVMMTRAQGTHDTSEKTDALPWHIDTRDSLLLSLLLFNVLFVDHMHRIKAF
jgi:hypothetical protein